MRGRRGRRPHRGPARRRGRDRPSFRAKQTVAVGDSRPSVRRQPDRALPRHRRPFHACQPVPIACDANVDIALSAEASNQGIEPSRVASYDFRSTMGKNGVTDIRLFAPAELGGSRDSGRTTLRLSCAPLIGSWSGRRRYRCRFRAAHPKHLAAKQRPAGRTESPLWLTRASRQPAPGWNVERVGPRILPIDCYSPLYWHYTPIENG